MEDSALSIWIAAAALAAQVGTASSAEEAAETAARTCVAPEDATRSIDSFSLAERQALIACSQQVVASLLSERLPIHLDESTTLVAVTAMGTELTYEYRVSKGAAAFDGGFDARMARSVCAHPGRVIAISQGGAYRHIWKDGSGRVLHRLTVDRCGDAAGPMPTT